MQTPEMPAGDESVPELHGPPEPPENRARREWQRRTDLFWRRHTEIMKTPGTLGFSIDYRNMGPYTVFLDRTADLPRVRQAVRALIADMGLTPGDLRFAQKDPPPSLPHIAPGNTPDA